MILTNDFHHTHVAIYPKPDGALSVRQVQRARRVLCPSPGCTCAEDALGTCGMRGLRLDARDTGEVYVCETALAASPLERWRHAQHLSTLEAARLFGVALPTYTRWEAGTRYMSGSAQMLLRLYQDHSLLARVRTLLSQKRSTP